MTSMITLTLKEQPTVPLEAELLSPDVVAGLANDEIRALPVHLGKRQRRVEDFFDVEGAASDEVEIRGEDYLILRERDVHAVAAPRIEGTTGLYL